MFLELYIDGKLRDQVYMDETIEFRKMPGHSFVENCDMRKHLIDLRIDNFKDMYWEDITACNGNWYVLMIVKSTIGREHLYQWK